MFQGGKRLNVVKGPAAAFFAPVDSQSEGVRLEARRWHRQGQGFKSHQDHQRCTNRWLHSRWRRCWGCESRRSGLRFVRLNLAYSPSVQRNANPDEPQLIITVMISSVIHVFHHFMLGVIASWPHEHVTHVIAVYAIHLWGHITCFSVFLYVLGGVWS